MYPTQAIKQHIGIADKRLTLNGKQVDMPKNEMVNVINIQRYVFLAWYCFSNRGRITLCATAKSMATITLSKSHPQKKIKAITNSNCHNSSLINFSNLSLKPILFFIFRNLCKAFFNYSSLFFNCV